MLDNNIVVFHLTKINIYLRELHLFNSNKTIQTGSDTLPLFVSMVKQNQTLSHIQTARQTKSRKSWWWHHGHDCSDEKYSKQKVVKM